MGISPVITAKESIAKAQGLFKEAVTDLETGIVTAQSEITKATNEITAGQEKWDSKKAKLSSTIDDSSADIASATKFKGKLEDFLK